MAHQVEIKLLEGQFFKQELSESDDFPTLIELDVHEVSIEQVLGKWFLHIGFESSYVVPLTVEVEPLEPGIDKLRKTTILLFRAHQELI